MKGLGVALGLLLYAAHWSLDALATMLLWNWHVSRVFGVAPLVYQDAAALSLCLGFVLLQHSVARIDMEDRQTANRFVVGLFSAPLVAIALGYLLTLITGGR